MSATGRMQIFFYSLLFTFLPGIYCPPVNPVVPSDEIYEATLDITVPEAILDITVPEATLEESDPDNQTDEREPKYFSRIQPVNTATPPTNYQATTTTPPPTYLTYSTPPPTPSRYLPNSSPPPTRYQINPTPPPPPTRYQSNPKPPPTRYHMNPTPPPTRYQTNPAQSSARYNERNPTSSNLDCQKVKKVVLVEHCEPYTVETCWTEAKEECFPKLFNNCTGVIETSTEQVCFDVQNEVCDLVESVTFERAEDNYQAQECFFGYMDKVCGTTFEIETFEKDDYQCLDVEVLDCRQEEKFINDVKCVLSSTFECKKSATQPGQNSYPSSPWSYGGGGTVCSEKPKQDCFNIPKKVYSEVCKTVVQRQCETFSYLLPMPVEKETCKPFTKKTCDFQVKILPKIAKKFSYTKQCQKKDRVICEHVEKKSVQPNCETSERISCEYNPREHPCKHDNEMYCHEVEREVEEEVCNPVSQMMY